MKTTIKTFVIVMAPMIFTFTVFAVPLQAKKPSRAPALEQVKTTLKSDIEKYLKTL